MVRNSPGRSESLAEIHLDVFELLFVDTITDRVSSLRKGEPDRMYWENYMRRTFKTSPLLCIRLAKLHKEYTDELRLFAKKTCMDEHKIDIQ
jgi:hypothetical protein